VFAALVLAAAIGAPTAHDLPRIVFVSRHAAALPGVVPGLGPRGHLLITGGTLMVRERDGSTHALIAGPAPYDVSDPCVSWDARRIIFAGVPARDSSWRIYIVGVDGRNLRALPHAANGDDIDPVWLPDGRVCFASTRFALESEHAGIEATNLWVMNEDGSAASRITADRNGAEEPAIDPTTGRIVYSREWTNRFRASDRDPSGITTVDSLAIQSEHVDLWQAVSITLDGDGLKLAAGDARNRDDEVAYQCAFGPGGRIYSVRSFDRTLGADAASGAAPTTRDSQSAEAERGTARSREENSALGVQWSRGVGAVTRLVGAGTGRHAGGKMLDAGAPRATKTIGPASACAPAVMRDGRVLFSFDPDGSGDYDLWIMDRDGRTKTRLCGRPGALALDAAPIEARPLPPRLRPSFPTISIEHPATKREEFDNPARLFRFDCLNVFANAGLDAAIPDAPPLQSGVRIRFFAALARANGGDSAVLLREAPVERGGAVHQSGLPGDVPMFEQLVDEHGSVLMSAHGPAHVAGYNFARAGTGTKCIGCHAGHSAQTVPVNALGASYFNASPAAWVQSSGDAPGTNGARAAVDRSTLGNVDSVAWIAAPAARPWIRLEWRTPIEIATLVLHAVGNGTGRPAEIVGGGMRLRFFLGDQQVGSRDLMPAAPAFVTRVDGNHIVVDAMEIAARDTLAARKGVMKLAEIEIIARIANAR
jgi:hypothetical protein